MIRAAGVEAKQLGQQRCILQLMERITRGEPLQAVMDAAAEDVASVIDPDTSKALTLHDHDSRRFTEEDAVFLQSVARVLSVAVELHNLKRGRGAGEAVPAPELNAAEHDIAVGTADVPEPHDVEIGCMRVDIQRRAAWVDGDLVELPPMEAALLIELATHLGGPISAEELGRGAWPDRPYTTADDVRRHIYRLRRSLGDHERMRPLIRNRRGFGYLLEDRPT